MINQPLLCDSKFYHLSDGKAMRYALFEPPQPRATLLAALGRREFIEKKYKEIGERFLQLGFRVIIFEWRGQGLSDRFLNGTKRQHDHSQDFSLHLSDLDSFFDSIVKPLRTGPLFATGHSLGGHLLLRWLVEKQPETIRAVFLTAPMLALSSVPIHSIARAMTWTAVRLGHGSDYAPAQHDYNARDKDFRNNPLSHDPERFAVMERYFTAHPELTVGGVTWGWLDAALISMQRLQQKHYFETLKLPILTITGGADHVTPAVELGHVVKRIAGAQHVTIPDARHDIMNESDVYRNQAWQHIDRFLSSL